MSLNGTDANMNGTVVPFGHQMSEFDVAQANLTCLQPIEIFQIFFMERGSLAREIEKEDARPGPL